uniref:DUF5615 domain-containing protein n=1 Tax=Candidatus Kentrum sp. FM TaxID=2126340 RepID=A0A450X6E3_9GAMM|nr:MAG: hypothetical protein BECKFM1743C_GA0114222_105302 [Candidatus Kentron sp. FM]VFK24846.1 MAG: hypothetical protein BECKFM1743B_GA0114221_110242 [Candidatus Kentron sp. FM]
MGRRRYLIDENTTPALGDQLRRRQPALEVVSVGDETAPPKGTCDPDILLWIETHGFTLVTRNRKSMPDHLHRHLGTGHHIPGILTVRPKAPLRGIVEDLLLIWELADANDYRDQIIHIPL